MKRLRSFGDEIDKAGEKWDRRDRDRDRDRESSRDRNLERSSSYRRFNGRSRGVDDDWESSSSRSARRRYDYDFDGFDRRKSYDRHRDSIDRNDYGGDRMNRSESFSGYRREFGKGYELERERERLRREESVSSWRRLSGCKDDDEDCKLNVEVGRGWGGNARLPQGSREMGRSPQGLRDVGRSPQSSRDMVKSPHGSKDSVGDQLNSGEMKTSEEAKGESSSSSEMEEGELEPDPEVEHELLVQHALESKLSSEEESKCQDFEQDSHVKVTTNSIDESKPLPEKQLEVKPENVSDENGDRTLGTVTVVSIESDAFQECHKNLASGTDDTKETKASTNGCGEKEENIEEEHEQSLSTDHQGVKEEMEDEIRETSLHLHDGAKVNAVGLEVENKEMNFMDSNEVSMEEKRQSDKTLTLLTDIPNGKDKGKSIAISQSSETNSREICWAGKDLLASIDDNMEGPSSRGFELFSRPTVTRSEKRNYSVVSDGKKLKTEPLELSLALPNILLPLPSRDLIPTPSSPVRTRSVQSFSNTLRPRSDGVSGSMSFSGSQTFFHNPSCSLTQNSFENFEQSVGSHPLFQGADLQVSHILSNEPKQMESTSYQRAVNENGCHASQTSNGISHIQAVRGQQIFKLSEGSSGGFVGQDRESNLHRQISGLQSQKDVEVIFPTNSAGSRETISEFSNKTHIVKERSGSQHRSSSLGEMDKLVIGGISFVERMITMIVFDPVLVIARRIEEMAEQSVAFLKESACEIIVNKNKRGQLHAFQEALRDRSDLTVEILSKSHRAQLEILVAFKTGLQDFLLRAGSVPSADLAEIYNNVRCRNLACLSVLPVDDCECKMCVEKNGFCSMCTCLICSKYDMALNTCSWVGCDVCLHWCHTDCALQMSFVKNGRSVGVDQEGTETQFHCVACNHPSEMFGFVKDVFKSCAKDWNVETLAKELEYVRRIFSASYDPRGKQLHIIAEQMIARLEAKSNLSDVYNHIIHFLNESDTEFGNRPTTSLKEIPPKIPEGSNGVTEPTQVPPLWLASSSTENIPRRDIACTISSRSDMDQMARPSRNLEFEFGFRNLSVVDELESIIKIKHAEAKMFQARADEARKDAEGLKRIAVAKNEKFDEEYLSRITKLSLADTEEKRKQKVNELKLMEREHREYFSMKVRMESEIRLLLLKMEATKQNFGT